jgi:O-antigen ligase
MRTALDPNDASLIVRIENQKKLAVYLSSRPMGGGIGSGGFWGNRFSPGSFLSQVALDSWYVKIWVETGIIGLVLHIASLILILIIGIINIFRLKNPDIRQRLVALICGYFGIVFASYGNQILGQMPTGTVINFTMVYMFLCIKWDNEITEKKNLGSNQKQINDKLEAENFKLPFEVGNRLERRVKVKVI